MSVGAEQGKAPVPAVVSRERLKGVGIGVVAALVATAPSMPTPIAITVFVTPALAAALIVAAVLTAAWSRTVALTAALTVLAVNALAFVAQAAIGLSGLLPAGGTLSDAANTWLAVLISLGTSWLLTVLAGAFVGGWALRRIIERRGPGGSESAYPDSA